MTAGPPLARPLALCLVAALLFGASTPLAKRLLEATGPVTLAGLFYAGAALGVLPFARGGEVALRRDGRNRRRIALTSLLGGCVAPVLVLLALRQAPAASVALWLNLEAAATAALGVLIFGEHVGWRSWLAVGLTVAGGALLAGPAEAAAWSAAGLVAVACVCWGVDNHLTSIIDGFTPAQVTLAKGALAGLTNLTAGLLLEGPPPPAACVAALGLGALSYGASVVLYVRGAHALGATRAQLAFATAPFWGAAGAWLLLREAVLPAQVAAGALMVLAIVSFARDHHAHRHGHVAETHTHEHTHDDGHHDHAHEGLPASTRHAHAHEHAAREHSHGHHPDLHHRHDHDG
jgi:drug/metabolite transporter (DMT)-like permease